MDSKIVIVVLMWVTVLCESRGIHTSIKAQARFGPWRQRSQFPMNNQGHQHPSQGQGYSHGQGKGQGPRNSLTHSLSLDNLNLGPGETKVIKQTIVLRGRQPGHPQGTGQQPGGGNPRSGRRRFRTRLTARRRPQLNNRGNGQHPMKPGMFLLRTSGLGSPQLVQRNGVANLALPILHANHPAGGSGGNRGGSARGGHGNGGAGGSTGSGSGQPTFAHVIFSGSPNIVIVPQHTLSSAVTMTSSTANGGHSNAGNNNNNNAKNSNINGMKLPSGSVTYTKVSPKASAGHAQIVQTTVEPGEDPPEAP